MASTLTQLEQQLVQHRVAAVATQTAVVAVALAVAAVKRRSAELLLTTLLTQRLKSCLHRMLVARETLHCRHSLTSTESFFVSFSKART
jgi:hypothetical protein